jgi:hypothetical protein
MSGWNRMTIGRRRFVQLVGWAGAATIAQGGPALAESARKSKAASRPPEPTPSPTPASSEGEISAEARALAEVAKRRYGEHLSAADLEKVAKDLDGDLKGIQRLRERKLANADEPDATFRA